MNPNIAPGLLLSTFAALTACATPVARANPTNDWQTLPPVTTEVRPAVSPTAVAIPAVEPLAVTPTQPFALAQSHAERSERTVATTEPLQEGDRRRTANPWEVTLNGAGINDRKFTAGGLQASGSVGYYFNEVLELSLRQTVAMNDAGAGSKRTWDGVSRVALDLHFPFKSFVPFVGVNVGYVYGDTLKETLVGGPEAGVKIYVKPDVFLAATAEYEFFFDSSDRIGDAFDDGTFLYSLGFGVRF